MTELEVGIRMEMKEHGVSRRVARKITMDHLRKVSHLTSKNNGHRHTWRLKDERTSCDSGHSHPLNFNKMIAEKGKTDHIHRLLKCLS